MNTKRCPNCNNPVQQNGDPDYRLITCICSYSFCWICLRTEEEHNGKRNCVAVSAPVADSSSTELTQILHLNIWEVGHEALEKAKSKLRALEENIIPKLVENCGLSELDIRTVREAGMLIVQCRRVLKWSCVFDNFITEYESTKKQYLKHRRDQVSTMLCKHKGTLHELMNRALADGDFTCFKHMLETSTTYTGNYFDGFVKNLEDGMPEVKTEAYEDEPSSHWFCDRCTFENSWVDKQCKICFSHLNSPPHVAGSTGRPWKIGMRVMSKGHVSSVIDAGLVLCCSFSCVVLGLKVCFVCPLMCWIIIHHIGLRVLLHFVF